MYTLIIFDCDGVLIDSERLANQAEVELLAKHGVCLRVEDYIARFAGLSSRETLTVIQREFETPLPADFWKKAEDHVLETFQKHLQTTLDVHETILAGPSLRCIASNSSLRRLQVSLRKTGLEPYFSRGVFSAEMVSRPKPAPDLFLFAARSLGVLPENVLVVEDSVHGTAAAREAGMTVFGYTGAGHISDKHRQAKRLSNAGATRVFDSHRDMADCLRHLSSASRPYRPAL